MTGRGGVSVCVATGCCASHATELGGVSKNDNQFVRQNEALAIQRNMSEIEQGRFLKFFFWTNQAGRGLHEQPSVDSKA